MRVVSNRWTVLRRRAPLGTAELAETYAHLRPVVDALDRILPHQFDSKPAPPGTKKLTRDEKKKKNPTRKKTGKRGRST